MAESCADGLSPSKRGTVCRVPCIQPQCQCLPNHFRSIYAFNQCVPLNECKGGDAVAFIGGGGVGGAAGGAAAPFKAAAAKIAGRPPPRRRH